MQLDKPVAPADKSKVTYKERITYKKMMDVYVRNLDELATNVSSLFTMVQQSEVKVHNWIYHSQRQIRPFLDVEQDR